MIQPKSKSDTSVDYSRCPIPKTHRRLGEVHVLWHQALAQYQQPEIFRANLNATIEALRNITFILQSEKHLFSNFEGWYGPWQERLKADPVLKWLIEARNIVVKQGELETNSTAIVKLVTWRDNVLAELSVPPDVSPSLVLRNIPLIELVNNAHIPLGDVKNAAVVIERRWSVPDLEGREILEALAHAYGVLSDVVLDAHMVLGKSGCIPADGEDAHFPSAHHRTGTLACMVLGVEDRTHSFELSTGQSLRPVDLGSPLLPDPKLAAARYGLAKAGQIKKWQEGDPLIVAEQVLYIAKRILRKDRSHVRMMFIRDGQGIWNPLVLDASNRTEKHLLTRVVARFIESVGGDAIIDVGEAWTLKLGDKASYVDIDQLQNTAGRGEALIVTVATREGTLRTYQTPFTRGPFGGIKLGETVQLTKYQAYYLEPIFDVWRRQGTVVRRDGKRDRRIWEPDPLDTCFCGGPRRFGECCSRLLNTKTKLAGIDQDIHSLLTTGDFTRAEELARAGVGQYVIWIKQHTTPTMHVALDLHRDLVEVDLPALDSYLRQMFQALGAAGHSASLVSQLRHISRVVGVPELSVRVTALATQLLLESGDRAEAVKELKTLGDVENLNDTLALALAVELLDLPLDKKTQCLTRAAAKAFSREDKLFAELQLAEHLIETGQHAEGLGKLDSLIAELTAESDYREALAKAFSLRWKITKDEEDFRMAKRELETFADSEHRVPLAVLLMDHGDFSEAEAMLSKDVNAADPVAQLITIDARLRTGRIDPARELLLDIKADKLPGRLRYPYAVAFAHVALSCEDIQLKQVAVSHLHQLPLAGKQMTRYVEDLLAALTGSNLGRRESILTRFRRLFHEC